MGEVKAAQYFTVCADEAIDLSNKEQLPLVLRYVDTQGQAREEFIELILCDTGTSGRAIADKILDTLHKLSLDPQNLRGQAYDGAGNMAGKYRGAAALIQKDFPRAAYFHCAAHALNLCVVAACRVQSVQNMVGMLEQVCLFFTMSPKRHGELAGHISNLPESETSRKKLVNICKTRWVARIESFEVFISLLPAVVETFEVISTESTWNTESSRKAASLLLSITQFGFLITLVVFESCFGYTKGLTVALQSRSIDICTAYREVNVVKAVLADVRENISQHHSQLYQAAVQLSENINSSPPSIPRRCGKQTQRANVSAETPEEYYRRALTIPFIDHLLSHIEMRFSDLQHKATMALKIIPSVICQSS